MLGLLGSGIGAGDTNRRMVLVLRKGGSEREKKWSIVFLFPL